MSAKVDKVGRTVRLSSEVNQRLIDLCTHLGVNPNAYLVGEIGKAVARDELSFVVKGQSLEAFAKLANLIEGAAEGG